MRVTSLKFLLTCPSQEEEIKVLVLMNYLKSLAPSGLNDLKMLTDVLVNSGPYKMSTRRIIYRSVEVNTLITCLIVHFVKTNKLIVNNYLYIYFCSHV